jgi:hypothetical protein
MAPNSSHCGGVCDVQLDVTDEKLGTASYVTISGSENSVTFETQRLIRPPQAAGTLLLKPLEVSVAVG